MKHGLLTALPRIAPALSRMGGIAAAALFLASMPPASAGIFGASKNDVAVKVAELPNPDSKIYPLGLDFGVDGNRIAVESQNGKIHIWDWRGKRVEQTLVLPDGGNALGVTNPVQFSADGRFLAACEVSGAGDVVVRIWDAASWSIAKDISASSGIESRGSCKGMSFTPGGQYFVRTARTGGKPGNNLIVYEVGTWQPLWGLQMEGLSPVSIAISPNGELAAIAGTVFVVPQDVKNPIERARQTTVAAKVNIVNLKQRSVVRVMNSQKSGAIGPVAWSPDGKRIAIAGGSGVELVDAISGEIIFHEELEEAAHMNVRFTSDNRYFIECDENGRGTGLGVKIWDYHHEKLLQEMSGNIGSIAVTRDGKYLAVGTAGRTTIWQFK